MIHILQPGCQSDENWKTKLKYNTKQSCFYILHLLFKGKQASYHPMCSQIHILAGAYLKIQILHKGREQESSANSCKMSIIDKSRLENPNLAWI